MERIVTMNNNVAIEPFVFNHDQKRETTARFNASDKLSGDLICSKVAFATEDGKFAVGDIIFVSSDVARNLYIKKNKVEDKEVTIVSYNHIMLVKKF